MVAVALAGCGGDLETRTREAADEAGAVASTVCDAIEHRGAQAVLVTGGTGQGKSTTLAALMMP